MPRGSGGKARGGAAERGKAKAKGGKANPTPQVDIYSIEESQLPTDMVEKPLQTGDDTPLRKRKKAQPLSLTREQEESSIEWLKDHPELFDKSDASYKDSVKKKALWNAKAEELGQESGVILLTWYRSMRTRYGKLQKTKTKSGASSSPLLTQHDQWIVQNFQCFKPHI